MADDEWEGELNSNLELELPLFPGMKLNITTPVAFTGRFCLADFDYELASKQALLQSSRSVLRNVLSQADRRRSSGGSAFTKGLIRGLSKKGGSLTFFKCIDDLVEDGEELYAYYSNPNTHTNWMATIKQTASSVADCGETAMLFTPVGWLKDVVEAAKIVASAANIADHCRMVANYMAGEYPYNSAQVGYYAGDCISTIMADARRRRSDTANTAKLDVPAAWTCKSELYGEGKVCNLGCGAPDPDCVHGILPLVHHRALAAGAPKGWLCPAYMYDDGQCDIGCGVMDVDCLPATLRDRRAAEVTSTVGTTVTYPLTIRDEVKELREANANGETDYTDAELEAKVEAIYDDYDEQEDARQLAKLKEMLNSGQLSPAEAAQARQYLGLSGSSATSHAAKPVVWASENNFRVQADASHRQMLDAHDMTQYPEMVMPSNKAVVVDDHLRPATGNEQPVNAETQPSNVYLGGALETHKAKDGSARYTLTTGGIVGVVAGAVVLTAIVAAMALRSRKPRDDSDLTHALMAHADGDIVI
eukprot:TRINITY_DN11917_c3_g1_i1.p1 TRINITY_DN11917_c3_g1~~TRINITY_DN11917_c3_g1_i1.p1  ORF type:complete len:599 (+),score=202.77 TRINITY_DN11917_c3_g1_i1:200-1798(+)